MKDTELQRKLKGIAIFGVGGFGREVLTLIENINKRKPTYNIVGFFDDGYPKGELHNEYPILGSIDELNTWPTELAVNIAIEAKIINQLEIGANTIVGAGAVVAESLSANCTAVGVPAKVIKQQ